MNIKQIDEVTFDERYKLLNNHIDTNSGFDGKMFETFGGELEFVLEMVELNRVISIVETDEEEINDDNEISCALVYVSGFHRVNVLGYLVTLECIREEFEVKLKW